MKQVLIFVVVLFLGIFGARFYIQHKREVDTKEAKAEYQKELQDRKAAGDALDMPALIAQLDATKKPSVVEIKEFREYLDGGFVFNCQNLEKKGRKFGGAKVQKLFNPKVGQFGPHNLEKWRGLINPPIVTNPSRRLLASKVLRNFDAWEKPMNMISFAIIKGTGTKVRGVLGLHKIREVEAGVKAKYFTKILEYQKALAVLGRLEFYKGDRNKPYDAAADMIRLSDLFALEAILEDELEMCKKLDAVMVKYIDFLATNGASGKHIAVLQKMLTESSIDKVVGQRVRVKRIATKVPLEKSLSVLVKSERDALSLFESGFVLTDLEKWRILKMYTEAGVILNYDDFGAERSVYDQSVLEDFGKFISEKKAELKLNYDAEIAVNTELKKLEDEVHDSIHKQIIRDEAVVRLAIVFYKKRTGVYPTELGQLTSQDVLVVPTHPLTKMPYNYSYVKLSEAELAKRGGVEPFPNVSFSSRKKSVIKSKALKD